MRTCNQSSQLGSGLPGLEAAKQPGDTKVRRITEVNLAQKTVSERVSAQARNPESRMPNPTKKSIGLDKCKIQTLEQSIRCQEQQKLHQALRGSGPERR